MGPENENPYDTQHDPQHLKRDSETQMMLGLFITILSIPVIIGTFWAETFRQTVVNLVAGLVLTAIGVGIMVWGVKNRKRAKQISGS